jgi:phage/conjugal plasmid C-4 type zinc finger TraR family protein
VTDIYDQASVIEELHRQHALDRQRAQSNGPDTRYLDCMDCGESIPLQRRKAVRNCCRCIDCEKAAEARKKLMR